jgi:hypothetical protein
LVVLASAKWCSLCEDTSSRQLLRGILSLQRRRNVCCDYLFKNPPSQRTDSAVILILGDITTFKSSYQRQPLGHSLQHESNNLQRVQRNVELTGAAGCSSGMADSPGRLCIASSISCYLHTHSLKSIDRTKMETQRQVASASEKLSMIHTLCERTTGLLQFHLAHPRFS